MWVVGEISFNRLVTLMWSDNLYVVWNLFVLDICDDVGGVMRGALGGFCCACVPSEGGNQMGSMYSAIHLLRLYPACPSLNSGCMHSIWVA